MVRGRLRSVRCGVAWPSCADDNERAIARLGGLEAVVAALKQHAGVAGVAEAACGALGNLSFDGVSARALRCAI